MCCFVVDQFSMFHFVFLWVQSQDCERVLVSRSVCTSMAAEKDSAFVLLHWSPHTNSYSTTRFGGGSTQYRLKKTKKNDWPNFIPLLRKEKNLYHSLAWITMLQYFSYIFNVGKIVVDHAGKPCFVSGRYGTENPAISPARNSRLLLNFFTNRVY